MNSTKPILAVVGGGSIAASFINQLAESFAREGCRPIAQLWVFEPREHPGAGDAFQDDGASNILNTRAAGISAVQGNPNHFFRWAIRHEAEWRADFPQLALKPDAYLPRALFGRYLRHVYDEAVALLRQAGVIVCHWRTPVVAMRRVNEVHELCAEDGAMHIAELVVLTLGNQESVRFDHLRHHDGYFARPYPCCVLGERIERNKAVCILGSGLSAIDAAVTLVDAGHRGKITMVSRNGRLPTVRREQGSPPVPRAFSRSSIEALLRRNGPGLRLREVGELLLRELDGFKASPGSLDELLAGRAGMPPIDNADAQTRALRDRAWRNIVACLHESIDLIWHHLPIEDRRIVERDFKPLWLSYRMAFPQCNARKIQALLQAEKLGLHRGCAEVRYDPAMRCFEVDIVDRQSGFVATLHSSYVINATGYTTDAGQCRSALIRNLLASGLARSHEFGGLEVDFATSQLMTRAGTLLRGLYVLGSMASGTYFWTSAMDVNARLATAVARGVLAQAQAMHAESPAELLPLDGDLCDVSALPRLRPAARPSTALEGV